MPTADYSINPGIKYLTNFRQGVVDLMLGPARWPSGSGPPRTRAVTSISFRKETINYHLACKHKLRFRFLFPNTKEELIFIFPFQAILTILNLSLVYIFYTWRLLQVGIRIGQ